jgi:hypothetical protein
MPIVKELEINYVKIPDSCNPICLYWRNSKGGLSPWVFLLENEIAPEYNRGEVFNKGIEDYTKGVNIYASLPHQIRQGVTVSAKGIELQEIQAIEFIGAAPVVWEVTKDGAGGFNLIEVEVTSVQANRNIHDLAGDIFITFKRPNKSFL